MDVLIASEDPGMRKLSQVRRKHNNKKSARPALALDGEINSVVVGLFAACSVSLCGLWRALQPSSGYRLTIELGWRLHSLTEPTSAGGGCAAPFLSAAKSGGSGNRCSAGALAFKLNRIGNIMNFDVQKEELLERAKRAEEQAFPEKNTQAKGLMSKLSSREDDADRARRFRLRHPSFRNG
jgi:hypothetical protein